MEKFLAAVLMTLTVWLAPALAQDVAVTELVQRHAQEGQLAAAEAELAARPRDAQTVAALGMISFARAVETFGQGLYRHGLKPLRGDRIPLLRLPLPENPQAEPLSYDKLRAIYARFLADLTAAEAVLAGMPDGPVHLDLDLDAVRLDLRGDGRADPDESLGRLVARVSLVALSAPPADIPPWPVGFDRADTTWLRGYCKLLSAALEFTLAYDWHTTYDAAAHLFFAGAVDPSGPFAAPDLPFRSPILGGDAGQSADLVALLHLIRWPLAEPGRLKRARQDLKAVIALSRQSWREVLAETDDDHEWLPGPDQHSTAFPGMQVTRERLDTWLAALDTFDAALDGRQFLPHWRYRQGIDLSAVFEEPRDFDLVLWITGHAALPYLKDGPQVSRQTWAQWQRVFSGQFLTYAIWFN
jgi:hypothetical protein